MDKLLNYSLSDSDMRRILPRTKFTPYNEIHHLNNIEELLGSDGTAVIMYLTKERYGHWVCLFLKPDGNLSYFNSYGSEPDYEMTSRIIKPSVRIAQNQVMPHLYELICKSGKKCEYNDYKLQDENVSTCGRHVVLRLWNKHLNADEYANRLIKLAQVSKKPIDVVVSILTQNSLIKK